MTRRTRRGFTLVELIIVIAVIGVLAAILIPVFANVIDKGNIASKTSLARNLNTMLATETETAASVSTMGEALRIAHSKGFTDDQIFNTQTAGTIVFNSAKGNFAVVKNVENGQATLAYADGGMQTAPATSLFAAYEVGSMPTNPEFGMYLYDSTETMHNLDLTVSTSVDTGSLAVNSLTLTTTGVGPYVISGSCETLTVNAPNATVNHYGYANHVVITAVADQSYHEFGTVGVIDITAGHLVIEAGASVLTGINVIDLDEVTIETYAQAVIAGGSESDLQAIVNTENEKPTVAYATSSVALETIGFASGSGTENDPYIIRTRKQFENISNYSDDYTYFEVDPSVKEINAFNWGLVDLYGSIDGHGVTMKNHSRCTLFNGIWCEQNETVVIKNINIQSNIDRTTATAALGYALPRGTTLVENVNVSGTIIGSQAAGYFVYGSAMYGTYVPSKVIFRNCTNSATLVGSVDATGFIENAFNKASTDTQQFGTIVMENSKFIGSMCSANNSFEYFTRCYSQAIELKYSDDFARDVIGKLHGDPEAAGAVKYESGAYKGGNGAGWGQYLPTEKKIAIKVDNGTLPEKYETFTITALEDTAYAKASVSAAPNSAETGTGGYLGTFADEKLSVVDGKITTDKMRYFDIKVNCGLGRTGVSDDGHTFNIENSFWKTESLSGTVTIWEYNSNGLLLRLTKFAIPKA